MPDKGRGFDAGDMIIFMPLDESQVDNLSAWQHVNPFETGNADGIGMVQVSVAPAEPNPPVVMVKVFPPMRADAALVLARLLGSAGCRVKFDMVTN